MGDEITKQALKKKKTSLIFHERFGTQNSCEQGPLFNLTLLISFTT